MACLLGPVNGNQHDALMLCMSGLQEQLQELMPLDGGITYAAYSDPAYLRSDYICCGHHNAVPGSEF